MEDLIKLHLGCGPHIFPGWQNYDIAPGPGIICFDLRDSGSMMLHEYAHYIFTEHFIEHLTHREGAKFLLDCYAMLRPGGVLRVSTPDLKSLVDDYRKKKVDRYVPTWSPKTPAQFINEGMREWGHQYLYDFQELRSALEAAGFEYDSISPVRWHKSDYAELRDLEVRPYHNDLIVEAVKL